MQSLQPQDDDLTAVNCLTSVDKRVLDDGGRDATSDSVYETGGDFLKKRKMRQDLLIVLASWKGT
jgi:hypothetical protein